MIDDLIRQLNSPDPEQRKQAILALGRTRDPAALAPLADVYRNDPDPDVRELALKAGRVLRLETSQPAEPAAPAPEPEPEPPATLGALLEAEPPVSRENRERAQRYLDQALDNLTANDLARAAEALGHAYDLNPDLMDDVFVTNLASDITGLSGESATRLIADPVRRHEFIESRRGARKPRLDTPVSTPPTTDAPWGRALIDLGFYGLVNAILVFAATLISFQMLLGLFDVLFNSPAFTAQLGAPYSGGQVFSSADLAAASVPLAVLYALMYAAITVVMLFIFQGAVHLTATTLMGGEGTLPGLIRKTTFFYTLLVPISSVLGLLPFLFFSDENLVTIFNALWWLFALVALVWSGRLIGEAYQFDAGRGCASLLGGGIIIAIAFVCCVFTLGAALGQMLAGMPGGF